MLKKITFYIFILLGLCQMAVISQTRRALLIGINIYQPDKRISDHQQNPGSENFSLIKKSRQKSRGIWINLDGAVNDMEVMKAILIARFGFQPENIQVLKNASATRKRILSVFKTHLIEKSLPGDRCLFYFAGHGSQVKNSLSKEADEFDESLVPADSYRGVWDIRDKELWKLYNDVQDRGAYLTVIIDACHSGSISRGLNGQTACRYLSPDLRDAKDPAWYEQTPAEKGALIFSATQDFEQAAEIKDEDDINHGLFTWALLKTLRNVSVKEPAERILLKIKALIRAQGKTQEPNLEGTPKRKKQSLFGTEAEDITGETTIAVLNVLTNEKKIKLQGGIATGIRKGCELKQVMKKGDKKSPSRIRITEVQDLNLSFGEIIQGESKDIQSGDLFIIDKWVVSEGLRLGLLVSKTEFSHSDLLRETKKIFNIIERNNVTWVIDPVEQTPTHIMFWDDNNWKLKAPDGRIMSLGKNPKKDLIEKLLSGYKSRPLFFLNLPPTAELYKRIISEFHDKNSLVEISQSVDNSHYFFTGHYDRGIIEYALLLPNVTRNTAKHIPLPTRTDWIPVNGQVRMLDQVMAKLKNYAFRIMKIKAWLELSSPPDKSRFPYHLALKNALTEEIKTGGITYQGEIYGLILKTDDTKIGPDFDFHYVYVFSIDKFGKRTLLFPNRIHGTIENKLPAKFTDEGTLPEQIQLGNKKLFRISEDVFGIDTFILLITQNPIPDPEVLQMDGVRTRGINAYNHMSERLNPLQKLLDFMSSPKRGISIISPNNWSIERLSILSKPRKN